MTPEQIARDTEHSHQAAYFCAMNQYRQHYPCLNFLHSIPNGGERNKAVAGRMKAEGVKAGVPDVFLPFPKFIGSQWWHGLYIEFKRPKSEGKPVGRLSPEQVKWRDYLVANNFAHFVAYDYRQAVEATLNYLS
jgi:hypothetical protein